MKLANLTIFMISKVCDFGNFIDVLAKKMAQFKKDSPRAVTKQWLAPLVRMPVSWLCEETTK